MSEDSRRIDEHNNRDRSKINRSGETAMGTESQWQDIESAPKDGTELDLWCVNISRGSNRAMRFPAMFWDQENRCWEDCHSYIILEPKWRPTHWMPPPTPP